MLREDAGASETWAAWTGGADSADLAAGGLEAAFESGPLASLARFIVTNPEA